MYSGIRATGRLHLGNYLGAVKGMLALQESYDCIFSVVDLHTITVPYQPDTLQVSVRDIVLDYLAAGLNPEKCHLEIQSKVPQHTELAYLLSTIYPVSRLEDLPNYKEKKTQYPRYVNMGLLYYPVLMAADILLYKAGLVPVGIDQEPHLEVAREIARKFNSMFGQTFPQPQRFATEGEYVPSLTGQGKMSKSVERSYINLNDDLDTIRRKVVKIPTDTGMVGRVGAKGSKSLSDYEDLREGTNFGLYPFVELFLGKEKAIQMQKLYKTTGIDNYQEVKSQIAEAIYRDLKPFQEKRKEFENNPAEVDLNIKRGLEECRQMAEETMGEVRQKMGFI